MNSGDKRARVAAELRRDSERTNRAVAAACGVSPPTVASVRRELGLGSPVPSRERARRRVAGELLRDAARSDRALAALCGCSPPTVASVRKELGLDGVDRRGADGRLRRRRTRG
jgi:DNA-binding Lrp family transcriptional regulator